jgi:Na+/H+-dicarboxylate symporter
MKLPSLNLQIFIGAIAGLGLGWYFHGLGTEHEIVKLGLYSAGLLATLFIDLLKMILIPLVFCSITVGIANLRQHQQMHQVWVATLAFFVASMAIAIALGLFASNCFKPGVGMHLAMFADAMKSFEAKQLPLPDFFAQFLHGIFINPFSALSQGNVLAVVVFALILGIALVMGGERYKNILALLQESLEVCMRIVGWIMRLAPLGIFALLLKLIVLQDASMVGTLGKFIVVVLGTTLFHGVVVLPVILFLFTGKTPLWFWRGAREALVTAFATSSSNATLPVTLRCCTQHLHVKPEIAGFVSPLGATINMDGTALYEVAVALFVANLVGIDLNLTQQCIVFLLQ